MHGFDFGPLLIITTLAFFIPLLTVHFKSFNIPVVVGEIVCGILIGKSGLNLIVMDPWLDFLSIFGFTYLMFLSGMEIDLSFLKGKRTTVCIVDQKHQVKAHDPFLLGAKVFALTILVSIGFCLVLSHLQLVGDPLFLTLVLSTTSVGIVVPILRELGISRQVFGQDVLFSALIADFMTMLLITIYVAKVSTGFSLDLLLIFSIFIVFIVVYRLARFLLGKTATIKTLQEPSIQRTELKTRAAFALMVFFIVLAQKIGIEIILGAFLAGFFISLLSAESDLKLLHQKLNGVGYGFFIPLFFIMVGVRFDFKPLWESHQSFVLLPIFLGVAYCVKIIPCMILSRHYTTRNTVAAGILLSSRLTLIIAAADIGKSLNVITQVTYAIIILVAVISSTVSPILFSKVQNVTQHQQPVDSP